jgi:hypothetical protein
MTLEEPLHGVLLLHQKEGQETLTRTGLQTHQQMDHSQPLPPPTHPTTH